MGNGAGLTKTLKSGGDVYRSFLRLDGEKRRGVALRILRNQRVLDDLYDHFLIQEALSQPGRKTSWRAYLRRRRRLDP